MYRYMYAQSKIYCHCHYVTPCILNAQSEYYVMGVLIICSDISSSIWALVVLVVCAMCSRQWAVLYALMYMYVGKSVRWITCRKSAVYPRHSGFSATIWHWCESGIRAQIIKSNLPCTTLLSNIFIITYYLVFYHFYINLQIIQSML